MENEITKSDIRFVPETLYFNPPSGAWISGQIFMNGKQIGGGRAEHFTPDEISILNKIVTEASIRHIQHLNN